MQYTPHTSAATTATTTANVAVLDLVSPDTSQAALHVPSVPTGSYAVLEGLDDELSRSCIRCAGPSRWHVCWTCAGELLAEQPGAG